MPEPAAQEIDDWCRKQIAALASVAERAVRTQADLTSPGYRRLLGQHQAYMRVRSFISGARKAAPHQPQERAE